MLQSNYQLRSPESLPQPFKSKNDLVPCVARPGNTVAPSGNKILFLLLDAVIVQPGPEFLSNISVPGAFPIPASPPQTLTFWC